MQPVGRIYLGNMTNRCDINKNYDFKYINIIGIIGNII